MTNKIVNAVTGAVIGAGTKKLIDKITGKPVVKTTGNTGGTGGTKSPTVKTNTSTGGTGGSKTPVTKPVGKVTPKTTTSVTKPATGGTSGSPSATDIYKGTPADASLGLPEGAIDNGDGTYTVGGTTYSMDDDSVLYTTDADGKITVAGETDVGTVTTGTGATRSLTGGTGGTDSNDGDDTSGEPEYFTDEDGNVWSMDTGGAYTLFQYADGTTPDEFKEEEQDTYTDPDTGALWTLGEDGEWTTDYVEPDSEEENTYTDPDTGDVWIMDTNGEWSNTSSTDEEIIEEPVDDAVVEEEPPEEIPEERKGGLIAMMKQGGIPHYAGGTDEDDVDDLSYMPEDAEDNGDGTYTLDNVVYSMDSGNPLYTMDDNGKIIYVEPAAQSGYVDNGDGTYTLDGTTFDVDTDMPLYRDNPKGGVDYATDNNDGTYTVAGSTYSMDGNKRLYDTDKDGNIVNVSPTARYTTGNRLDDTGDGKNTIDKGFLDTITGALGTTAGAAGAGALLASLLGGDFSGGSGGQNQGVDMSKVGVIEPRTTDFGIGPTRYVGYEDYGVAPDNEYTPNEELLKNLNAPGYNPVNEGDYGYAEDESADTGELEDVANVDPRLDPEDEKPPKMATGGLSAMAPQPSQTHYTFGKPVDVYATLGLRDAPVASPVDAPQPIAPPQGQQPPQGQPPMGGLPKPPMGGMPQGMPPQMAQGAPQGMPPAMPPPMRRGGLPHASNVPMVEGRYDFRNGSAVHGAGDGQSDDIPAMLADGEYVIDAETVAQIGNGSTKAGAQALDKFRESIRAHKRSAPLNKIPPKTKALTSYLKGAK